MKKFIPDKIQEYRLGIEVKVHKDEFGEYYYKDEQIGIFKNGERRGYISSHERVYL